MRQLLPIMMLLILGAMAQPNPYLTDGHPNGLWWRDMNQREKVDFVAGVNEGNISTTLDLAKGLEKWPSCQELFLAVNTSREKSYANYSNGDLTREIDAFYDVGANLGQPAYTAIRYARTKLTGTGK